MKYSYIYEAIAGCYDCHGEEAYWFSKNAHAVAASI